MDGGKITNVGALAVIAPGNPDRYSLRRQFDPHLGRIRAVEPSATDPDGDPDPSFIPESGVLVWPSPGPSHRVAGGLSIMSGRAENVGPATARCGVSRSVNVQVAEFKRVHFPSFSASSSMRTSEANWLWDAPDARKADPHALVCAHGPPPSRGCSGCRSRHR